MEIVLEFRAGKMAFDGKKVVPDPRKGLVRIVRDDEGLVHFQWMERTHNVMEDSLIILNNKELQDQIVFPDEAVFEKVNQASGRIYILNFNSDDRKFFFWMQEPKVEDDQQLCNSVNYHINQPFESPAEGEQDVVVPLQISEDIVEEEISSRAANVVGPTMGTESKITSLSGAVKLEDLQRILSNIGTAAAAEDPDGGLGLGDILRPDLIFPLMDMLSLDECLTSFLPEGQCSTQEFMELLQSPPFRQQVDSFTYVLRTGQIDLSQFGIDPSKYKFTVTSFLEALEDSVLNASETEAGQEDDQSVRSQYNEPMDESK